MVPLLPETARSLNATVNGVWGGIGGTHPIVSHRDTVPAVAQRYGEDGAAFTADSRRAGLIPCGVVNGLEGFPTLKAAVPDLESMACRDASGKPLKVGDGMLLMCVNNPRWVEWERRQGELAIRQGAECLQLDTPMSAGFIAGILRGGFCDWCMSGFQRWMEKRHSPKVRRERYRLTSLGAGEVIPRLGPLQNVADPKQRPFHNSSPDDLLFREFIRFQEQSGFDSRKRLIASLRRYARSQSKQVAFTTNAADLGTVNPGGHWIRALMFADLFDFFVYELNPEPLGLSSPRATPYPRGKWAPYHRLAYAVHGRRSPAVIHAGAMGPLLLQAISGKSINAWMEVQSAEAYASNGAYVQYHVAPPAAKDVMLERCWAGTARHAAFVQSRRDLYDGDLHSGSDLAIVFLMNERGRTIPGVFPSYLGFAQALTESNVPFDVVFAGDGHFVRDRLSTETLRPYSKLLIPSPIEPTPNQRRVLQAFVRGGGTVVCQEPDRLGLRLQEALNVTSELNVLRARHKSGKGEVWLLRGDVSVSDTNDVGARFLRSYDPALRGEIVDLARGLGVSPMIRNQGLVSAFPVQQPKLRRMVIHLVNYDIDLVQDRVRDAAVPLEAALPRRLAGRPLRARILRRDGSSDALPIEGTAPHLKLTVPKFGAYCAVVIEGGDSS